MLFALEWIREQFAAISGFLSEAGYLCDINIPKRYRRHFDALAVEE